MHILLKTLIFQGFFGILPIAFLLFLWYHLCMENLKITPNKTSYKRVNTDDSKVLELQMEVDLLQAELNWYKEQFTLHNKRQFGASSEQTPLPDQISLFNEAEVCANEKATEDDLVEVITKRSKKKGKRHEDLKELPVERIDYTLTEEEQVCPVCDADLHDMTTQIRRELTIIPATVNVTEHVQHIYTCRACEEVEEKATIVKAPMPKAVLPKSLVSPSLLAHIMHQKFCLGLPLYRQEQEFKRQDIPINRQNMSNWVLNGSKEHLSHLYDRLHEIMVSKDIIHGDETDIQVLHEDGREATKKSKMWVYITGHTEDAICLYDYRTTRSGKHAVNFLKGFDGYLCTDGYTGYNAVPGVTIMGCVAHVRRKYNDALVAIKDKSTTSYTKAEEGLTFCNRLFKLESDWKDITPEERYNKRQEEMKPVLDAFLTWVKYMKDLSLPKSTLGQAIKYTYNLWPKIITILKDGRLELSNNRAERAVKPFVINRKNFLFCNTPRGAQSSAIVQSIVETAKINNLKPFDYLKHLLEQLPNIDTCNNEALDKLLPWSDELPQSCKS